MQMLWVPWSILKGTGCQCLSDGTLCILENISWLGWGHSKGRKGGGGAGEKHEGIGYFCERADLLL